MPERTYKTLTYYTHDYFEHSADHDKLLLSSVLLLYELCRDVQTKH